MQSLLLRLAGELPRPRQRRHELHILTCYMDFAAIQCLIRAVSKCTKLRKVRLIFEYMEIFRSRRPNEVCHELEKIQAREPDIEFEFIPVRAGLLMHAKGYAVVQVRDGTCIGGIAVTSSGNATIPGLGQARRHNVEISNSARSLKDIRAFLAIMNRLAEKRVGLDDAATREDRFAFHYALLCSGVFLHKWVASLSSQIALQYRLTKEGRQNIVQLNEEFRNELTLEQSTVSRQPLQRHGMLGKLATTSLPPQFSRTWTIDTLLGRWCPREVWDIVDHTLAQNQAFQQFAEEFQMATRKTELEVICQKEASFENRLVNSGYVEADDERIARWAEKISDIRDDEQRLRRIFFNLEAFSMPYDYTSRPEIEALFESLYSTTQMCRAQSRATRKVLESIKEKNLDPLHLDEAETEQISALFA